MPHEKFDKLCRTICIMKRNNFNIAFKMEDHSVDGKYIYILHQDASE